MPIYFYRNEIFSYLWQNKKKQQTNKTTKMAKYCNLSILSVRECEEKLLVFEKNKEYYIHFKYCLCSDCADFNNSQTWNKTHIDASNNGRNAIRIVNKIK